MLAFRLAADSASITTDPRAQTLDPSVWLNPGDLGAWAWLQPGDLSACHCRLDCQHPSPRCLMTNAGCSPSRGAHHDHNVVALMGCHAMAQAARLSLFD